MAREIGPDYMPYAPVQPVVNVIQRMRDGRLPDPLTLSALTQVGIAEGNSDRVHKALRFLGLIRADGSRTDTFTRLGRVTTEEYPTALAEVIRAAYAPILRIVNPATDTDITISDAFRAYEPSGQREKMVALFRALAVEANLAPPSKDGEGRPKLPRTRRAAPTPRRRSPSPPPSPSRPPVVATPSGGDEFTVQLHAGGTVTLRVHVGHFALSRNKTDREFVQKLIDDLTAYQQPDAPAESGAEGQDQEEATTL